MNGLLRASICCLALAVATAAQAQEASPAADTPPIVVTGNREVERTIRDFVGALAERPVNSQLSRFEQSVCPAAVGLSPAQRDATVSRLRRVAEAAGIRVDTSPCVANVVVVVTSDKRAFMEALRRKRPAYFGDLQSSEIARLLATPGPAVAWQLQGPPMSARGTEIRVDPALGLYVNRSMEPASRLTAAARPQFAVAVVVIEAHALVGLTPTQLADYAAMRAYAGTDPARLKGGAPTILNVLEAPMGSEVAASVTHWDMGFLRGLYATPPNLYAGAHRAAIRREVAREIDPTGH